VLHNRDRHARDTTRIVGGCLRTSDTSGIQSPHLVTAQITAVIDNNFERLAVDQDQRALLDHYMLGIFRHVFSK
jgi:hypothetical protein